MRRLLLLAVCCVLALPVAAQQRPRNVIFFIADGFGPASATFAREYARLTQGRIALSFDSLQTGAVSTWATDSRVTDSAAGGTALATGYKTYNGAIAVDTLKRPVATLLEAAEKRGMATGLVVTTRITHATPAAFSAHVPQRGLENEIAAQQIEQGIDVIFGGGERHFLPPASGGIRPDDRDLMAELEGKGYTRASDLAAFRALRTTPAVALLAKDQLAYEIDRDPEKEPSLAEMTEKAISLLKADKDGFFLMVEASRIDHSGHENDAAGHLHDIFAFDEAFAAAVRWAAQDGNTLVISTADHETGGLSLGRDGIYAWHPQVLASIQVSQMLTAQKLLDNPNPAAIIADDLGITDLTDKEKELLGQAMAKKRVRDVNTALSQVVGKRAGIAWTTTGHSGVDVNLYAFGPGQARFVGNFGNDVIGRLLAELMGFDLEALTRTLQQAE